MTEKICTQCGKTTIGEYANYCSFCGNSLTSGITNKKLMVMQEVFATPEEIEKLLKQERF